MSQFQKKFKKLTTKEICIIAMLIAVTVVLSFISGYLRTPVGKLNISFISVYVCAYLFGPLMGGITGALADLISVWVSASGAPIPLFTVIEFINGFIYLQTMYVFCGREQLLLLEEQRIRISSP